jgi:hypothetical protein
MIDRIANFIVSAFEITAAIVIYVLTESGFWLVGRVLGIPLSTWDNYD